jgi:hypothetical protein
MKKLNKPSDNTRFWTLCILLVGLMLVFASCSNSKTAYNCAAYGMSWDRSQAGR